METLTALDIHLENFEGPLDLLMHLIKKNNLDIYDIPIAQITGEYLQYLDVMKSLNLEIAGEFLVMAATLMQIKAKMLLPAPEAEGGENGPDPRGALVSMLEEYQRYKEASKDMNGRFARFKDAFYRGSPVFSNEDKYLDLDMFALMDAVQRAFKRVEKSGEVDADPCPIDSRIEKVQRMLEGRQWLLLDDIFATENTPRGVITCFMAVLELIKLRKIVVSQDEAYTEVRIYPAPAAHAPEAAPAPSQEPEPEPEPAPAEEMPAPAPEAEAAIPAEGETFVEENAPAAAEPQHEVLPEPAAEASAEQQAEVVAEQPAEQVVEAEPQPEVAVEPQPEVLTGPVETPAEVAVEPQAEVLPEPAAEPAVEPQAEAVTEPPAEPVVEAVEPAAEAAAEQPAESPESKPDAPAAGTL